MELLHAGVLDEWTEKSLSRLAEMMPGRYAKNEVSSDFLGGIDSYVYRAPVSQISVPASGDAQPTTGKPDQPTQHPVPMAMNDGGVKDASVR